MILPLPVGGCYSAGSASARRRCPCELLPLWAAVAPCGHRWPPFWAGPGRSQLTPCGGLGRGLAMGGRPCMGAGRPSSSLSSLQKHSENA
ncbi:hypothetical protein GW17_00048025 [Ensete ventricosum]|nr:hypothetical protein GW17_00048025 [Ensete ventricosum]